jgi:hypothetical protein
MGLWGKTSSTNSAAVSTMGLAPQLGQKPLRLQLKAAKSSALKAYSASVGLSVCVFISMS